MYCFLSKFQMKMFGQLLASRGNAKKPCYPYIIKYRYSSKVYGYSYPEPSYHPSYHHPGYQTLPHPVFHYQVKNRVGTCPHHNTVNDLLKSFD